MQPYEPQSRGPSKDYVGQEPDGLYTFSTCKFYCIKCLKGTDTMPTLYTKQTDPPVTVLVLCQNYKHLCYFKNSSKSFMKIKNNNRPKIGPCGTPMNLLTCLLLLMCNFYSLIMVFHEYLLFYINSLNCVCRMCLIL